MDELEITCIVKDTNGIISHYGVKGYGIQNIAIVEKLIKEEICSFFAHNKGNKMNVYSKTSTNGTIFLTIDPEGSDMDTLNFLPLLDRPLLKQIIEFAR